MNSKRSYLIVSFFLLIVTTLISVTVLNGCRSGNPDDYKLTGNTKIDGENLVRIHCTKCHAEVPLNTLTKDVWLNAALPSMSKYYGITAYLGGYFLQDTAKPTIKFSQWNAIVDYYTKFAPDSLKRAKLPVNPVNDWAGFKIKTPSPFADVAYTTMSAFNPFDHKIYTADGKSDTLTEWDSSLKKSRQTVLPSPTVSATFYTDGTDKKSLLACIGELQPTDFKGGKVMSIDATDPGFGLRTVESEINRPVQLVPGDFNKDGLTDIAICAQGYLKGSVDLYLQNKDHTYTIKNISTRTGAVQAVAGDFDHDGWTDLMVLFGSVDEGLCLFTNDHKGGFKERELLRFPPVYGSTSFQLTDIDHDGNPDLIYTCGYNYHNSRILKPYHGLYIYKNTGNWNFKQKWFYPIDGCTKAIAADFDGDGDMDIMTSAFFTDLKNNPAEGCIYFEQDKPFGFKPHTLPVQKYGRWFSMDVADYNGDGKPDVILGNYAEGLGFQGVESGWNVHLPFIVLENNFRK